MVDDTWWTENGLSLVLGLGLGLVYLLTTYVTHRRAERNETERSLQIVMGGMLLRLTLAVVLITLTLLLAPVRGLVFIGTFMLVFLAGLALEIGRLHRGSQGPGERSARKGA